MAAGGFAGCHTEIAVRDWRRRRTRLTRQTSGELPIGVKLPPEAAVAERQALADG
jgi:hypothetical protein